MFMTSLAKQLASLHASNIARLKLMVTRLGVYHRKLHILSLYQITVLLLTYHNRRVVNKDLAGILVLIVSSNDRNKPKTCLVIKPLHAPSKTNRG
jgi:hypothetical protein